MYSMFVGVSLGRLFEFTFVMVVKVEIKVVVEMVVERVAKMV